MHIGQRALSAAPAVWKNGIILRSLQQHQHISNISSVCDVRSLVMVEVTISVRTTTRTCWVAIAIAPVVVVVEVVIVVGVGSRCR